MADLRLILVTPERTLFDRPVTSVQVPMFDGSAGIYPGRAPLVGRLGVGQLKFNGVDGAAEHYFIEGGFVQVKGEQISVLTNAAVPISDISRADAARELDDARSSSASSDEEIEIRTQKIDRARKLVSLAQKD